MSLTDCVIYVRVSTDKQDYTRQNEDLKDFAKRNDYNIINVFEDKLSGFKSESEREGLKNLKSYVIDHSIKYVLCWELSRLARKSSVLFNLLDFFEDNKINIYFKKESLWLLDFQTQKKNAIISMLLGVCNQKINIH
jgi:DNA invertase Pin-like site-specific DNA recombinase